MNEIPNSGEKTAKVGDVELAYDTFGNPSSRPMPLIMGLGLKAVNHRRNEI